MADLATLGIKVTSDAGAAAADLNKLAGAAKTAASSVDVLESETRGAAAATDALGSSSERAAAQLNKAAAAGRMAARMQDAHTTSIKQGNAQRVNLIAQLNDIVVSLYSGQKPMMVAIQQGSQISGIYGSLGGLFRALGGILRTVFVRFGPWALAVGALGVAINEMGKGLKTASGKAVTFGDTFKAVFQVLGGYIMKSIQPGLDALAPYFDKVWKDIKEGTKIAFNNLVGSVLTFVELVKFGIKSIPDAFKIMGVNAANFFIDSINWLVQKTLAGVNIILNALNTASAELGKLLGNSNPGQIELFDVNSFDIKPLDDATDAAERFSKRWEELQTNIKRIDEKDFYGAFADDVAKQAVKNGDAREAAEKKTKAAADRAAEAYRDLIKAAKDRNDELRLEIGAVGQAGAKYEAAKKEQELLAQATEKGREISAAHREEIHKLAEEYGVLVQRLSEAKAINDLKFDREQIGRSPLEQDVASQLRDLYGDDYKSQVNGAIANTIRFNAKLQEQQDRIQEISDTVSTTLGGALASVFDGGIKSFDDFLDHVTKGFAQIAQNNIQGLFDKLFGANGQSGGLSGSVGIGGGSGGFDLGGLVSGLFGGGSSSGVGGSASIPKVRVANDNGSVVQFPSVTTNGKDGFSTFAQAISKIESGSYAGNYSARGPVLGNGDQALGRYQVMASNVPSWTKAALGKVLSATEFLSSKSAQDSVLRDQYNKNIARFGSMQNAASVWFTGRPINSRSSAATDVLGTSGAGYVEKFNAAVRGLPAAVKGGAEAGSSTGIQTGVQRITATASAGAGAQGTAANDNQQAGGGFNLMGGLGAALGGFGVGYQSQSAGMGAIGGALSGFASGGLAGGIIGGIAGLIGGLFGAKKKQKEAQKQLESQMAQIKALLSEGEGTGVGIHEQKIIAYTTEIDKAVDLAWRAGDQVLRHRLQDSVNTLIIRMDKDFRAGFEGTVEAYNAGYGQDSPFLQGQQAVEGLRDELRGLIKDTEYFNDIRRKGSSPELLPYYDAQSAQMLQDIRSAAINMATGLLVGQKAISEIEQAIQDLNGKAAALPPVLTELGLTAEQAADAIERSMTYALAKLKYQFQTVLVNSINDLQGFGFIKDIQDAQSQYQERLRDSAALGIDGSLALQEFNLTLRNIVKSADLTAAQIQILVDAFPAMASAFKDMLPTGGALSVADAADAVTKAQDALRSAYQKQSSELETTIQRMKDFIKSITEFKKNLLVDSSLSPLGPAERLAEAKKIFDETNTKALTGDEDAMNNLQGASQTYLDLAKAYYASSTDYVRIFDEVQKTLESTIANAVKLQTASEKELQALKDTVGKLIDIDDSVLSVEDAIAALNTANTSQNNALIAAIRAAQSVTGASAINDAYQSNLGRASDAAGAAYFQGRINAGDNIDRVNSDIAGSREGQIVAFYKSILGRSGTSAEIDYWLKSSKTLAQIQADITYAKAHGGYASGGYTGNGGTDQFAGFVHGQEFVVNADATRRNRPMLENINRGGMASNDNSGVAAEIKQLRQDNAKMVGALQRLGTIIGRSDEKTHELLQTNNEIQSENASEFRKVNSRL